MAKLEDLKNGASMRGVVSAQVVTIVSVDWIGDQAISVVFRDHNGTVAETVLYRDDEHRLEVEQSGHLWSFDAKLTVRLPERPALRIHHIGDDGAALQKPARRPRIDAHIGGARGR
jgi:hypothetical protein